MGHWGVSSEMGRPAGTPKVAADEEKMILFTFASTMAFSTLTMPETLF